MARFLNAKPNWGERPVALALVFAAFVTLASYTASVRGLWFDEGWSLFEGRHDVSFWTALTGRWMLDVHPPFFYMFTWLFEPLSGDGIFGRRMLNLIPLGVSVFAMLLLWRQDRRLGSFITIFAILILSLPASMDYFAEHRSYYALMLAAAILSAALWGIVARDSDFETGDYRLLFVAFLGMLGSFNLHYVGALEAGSLVGAFIIGFWLLGLRRWARRVLIAACFASLPVLASFLLQWADLAGSTGNSWIKTSTEEGIKLVLQAIITTLVVCALAGIGFGISMWKQRSQFARSPEFRFLGLSLIAVLFSATVLIAANMFQPMIVPRYLVVYPPFICAAVAAIAAGTALNYRVLLWAVAAYAILLIGVRSAKDQRDGRWSDTGRLIAAQREHCPGTVIHAIPHWQMQAQPLRRYPNEPKAVRAGYAEVARQFAFSIEGPNSRRLSSVCPTVIWVEHFYEAEPKSIDVIGHSGLAVPPSRQVMAFNQRGSSGFVTIIPR